MNQGKVRVDPSTTDALRQLKGKYFRTIDLKLWRELREVFTDDAVFEGFWAAATNPDRFVENVERNLSEDVISVHQGLTSEFEAISEDRLRGIWGMSDYLTWPSGKRAYLGVTLEGQRGVRGYGHYEEEYHLTPDGWKISYMRLTRLRIDPIIGHESTVDYPFERATHDWLPQ